MAIRTRFAPSPTGYLHLGSARTALFNWAFARHHAGEFALRVEDTDRERSTAESERSLLDGLEWLQLEWDGDTVRQSENRARHDAVIDEFLAEGKAYRCVCSREELEARKQQAGGRRAYDGRCRHLELGPDCGDHTVRLRLPEDADPEYLHWNDLVFGPSGQEAAQIGDMIIRRSDGTPLYNLAVVVDDIDMKITHVIRGADHQSNTSQQIAIYKALDAPRPEFAHAPLIVGASGKKLSKRRDPVSVQDFRQQGYLPQALLNWLVRLGWSHGDDEIFSREEIVEFFGLEAIGRSSAQADTGKLDWLNQHYLKSMPMNALLAALDPHLEAQTGSPAPRTPQFEQLLDLLRERCTTLGEMAEKSEWAAIETIEYDAKAASKHLKSAARPVLAALHTKLTELSEWDPSSLEASFEQVRGELDNPSMGKLAQPTRVAITGTSVSPGIYETLVALGRERSLERLGRAIDWIDANAAPADA